MKNKHITGILDEKRFSELNKTDLEVIGSHTTQCAACRRAFEAARISAFLLKSRAVREDLAPSPFFQTKVMNALRERQNLKKPFLGFRRWWQASYGLVGAMLVMVLAFVGLTVFAPSSNPNDDQAEMSNYGLYSTDTVIINQKMPRDLTAEQTLEVIYTERKDLQKK